MLPDLRRNKTGLAVAVERLVIKYLVAARVCRPQFLLLLISIKKETNNNDEK